MKETERNNALLVGSCDNIHALCCGETGVIVNGDRSFGTRGFLRVRHRLLSQLFDSDRLALVKIMLKKGTDVDNIPALVRLSPSVGSQCKFSVEPFGAFDAVIPAKSG